MPRAAKYGLLFWVASLAGAAAQDAKTCQAVDMDPKNAIAFARIAPGAGKVNFVKGAEGGGACPSAAEACKKRSFLLPGDLVLLQKTASDFVCAEFTSPRDFTTAGFLPAASLVPAPPPETPLAGWLGKWRTKEHQEIDIVRGKKPGELSVSGEATYGEDDPVRVKNGTVHFGEFSADVTPRGPLIELATLGDETRPFDTGEEYACKVRMRLFANSLWVQDNDNCGGANVRFIGSYSRRR